MKSYKKLILITVLAAFALISSGYSLAEERSIYIGDLIELQITTQKFTVDEIREKFKDFEIVELEKISDGFLVTLRTFEAGEKVVSLGDSEIIISVKSTLEEIDRDEPFEGSSAAETPGFTINYNYLFYAVVIIFAASGGVMLVRYIRKRRELRLTPFERFTSRLLRISPDDGAYLVKLTMYFKEYLESKFSLRIRGKTSTEAVREMSTVTELQPLTGKIREWMNESDYFKFSGNVAVKDKKQELLESLKEIVSEIERANEGKA